MDIKVIFDDCNIRLIVFYVKKIYNHRFDTQQAARVSLNIELKINF